MIIKRRQNPLRVLIIIALISSTILLFARINFVLLVHDTHETLMRLDPGFSSPRNLVDYGGHFRNQSMLEHSLVLIAKIPLILKHLIFASKPSSVPIIKINIKFDDLKKINEDRSRAIQKNYLERPQKVRAQITYLGETLDARVRLKGDLSDHWLSKYRYSLRVELMGDSAIMGMKSFSIQKPRSRQHPYDQAFQLALEELGNLTSNHQYAKIKLNGQNWGLMNIEEHLSAEFLEKKRKKDAPIFRFSDDLFWKNYSKQDNRENKQFLLAQSNYLLSDDRIAVSIVNNKKYLSNLNNRKIYSYIKEKKLTGRDKDIFSLEHQAKLFLSAFVWNNFHALSVHNTRYYFNPYSLKLEPISSDQGDFKEMSDNIFKILNQTDFPSHFYKIFDDFENSKLIEKILGQIISAQSSIEPKLNQFLQLFPLDKPKRSTIIKNNIEMIQKSKKTAVKRLSKLDRNRLTAKNIITDQQAKQLPKHIEARHYDNGEVLIFPLIDDKIYVTQIFVDGQKLLQEPIQISGFKKNKLEPYVIQTELTGFFDEKIIIQTSYRDNLRSSSIGPTLNKSGAYNPFLKFGTSNVEFIENVGSKNLLIKSGTYRIKKPLHVKGHLTIEPGVKLLFDSDSFLLITGTVNIRGSTIRPVTFTATNNSWKGFYLRSNSSKSSINNLIVENTKSLNAGILNLTGGFTVYQSDLSVRNLAIDKTLAEDAINLVESKIDIKGLQIRGSKSDAFDCDFCIGHIENSSINGAGGDGFDFSGSHVKLSSILVENVQDKAVSAGENSTLQLANSVFKKIGVGIAAKDESEVVGEGITISKYGLHAAMTYQKKMIFNRFSSLDLQNVVFEGDNPFKRQTGTDLLINSMAIEATEFNVKEMYSQGIMKK